MIKNIFNQMWEEMKKKEELVRKAEMERPSTEFESDVHGRFERKHIAKRY